MAAPEQGEALLALYDGARAGTFRDPFGHVWTVSRHVRDVPDDELRRAVDEGDAS